MHLTGKAATRTLNPHRQMAVGAASVFAVRSNVCACACGMSSRIRITACGQWISKEVAYGPAKAP